MSRRLIIDGNAVYEIDEECMLRKKAETHEGEKYTSKTEGEQNKDKKKRRD